MINDGDFISDNVEVLNDVLFNNFEINLENGILCEILFKDKNGMNNLSKVRKFVVSFVLDGKNFVMILNELRFSLKYDFVKEYGESYVKYFVMLVVVDGIKFEGFGRNKKLVKFRVV